MIYYYELCFYGDEDTECAAYDAKKAVSYCIKTEIPPAIDPKIALNILFCGGTVPNEQELRKNLTCVMNVTEEDAVFFDCEHLTKRVTDENGTYYVRDNDQQQTVILQTEEGKFSRRFKTSVNAMLGHDVRNFGPNIEPVILQDICDDMNCFCILNHLPFRMLADFEKHCIYKYPTTTTARPVDGFQVWDMILKLLPTAPATYWTNGDEILCSTEANAENLYRELKVLLGDGYVLTTGWYDPEEDKQNHDIDAFTGFCYVRLG